MSNSSRYFKLSDDILLEYVYTDITQDRDGECEDLVDLQKNSLLYVDNSFDVQMKHKIKFKEAE